METHNITSTLADPAASDWLKRALREAMQRDCVDAYQDADRLAQLLEERCDLILARSGAEPEDWWVEIRNTQTHEVFHRYLSVFLAAHAHQMDPAERDACRRSMARKITHCWRALEIRRHEGDR